MTVDDTGFLAGTLSEAGTGRRRLRIVEAAEIGSIGALETGSGGGGEGGGERWDVVFVLYVVQEKRLVGPLSLPVVESGVLSMDFLTASVFGGVECSCS